MSFLNRLWGPASSHISPNSALTALFNLTYQSWVNTAFGMSNSCSQTPAVRFHTYRHTSGALWAWKMELDILHMLQQREALTLTLADASTRRERSAGFCLHGDVRIPPREEPSALIHISRGMLDKVWSHKCQNKDEYLGEQRGKRWEGAGWTLDAWGESGQIC